MRILVDENLPRSLVSAFVHAGHDVEHASDVGLQGRSDPEVFAHAVATRRVLFTGDVGFGNVVTYPLGGHAGIVLSRVPTSIPVARHVDILVRALASLESDDLSRGVLVVVSETSLRIRRPAP